MGNFMDSFVAAREKFKQQKEILLGSTSSRKEHPVSSLMSRIPSMENWEHVMERLLVVRHILEWVAEENEGLYVNLARLEGLCRMEAKVGREKEYDLRKRQYLSALGKICELYYRVHGWQDIEFLSPGLGMKRILLCLDEPAIKKAPPHFVVFFVHEFPFLVTFDRQQILFACAAKEGVPGSTIYSEIS